MGGLWWYSLCPCLFKRRVYQDISDTFEEVEAENEHSYNPKSDQPNKPEGGGAVAANSSRNNNGNITPKSELHMKESPRIPQILLPRYVTDEEVDKCYGCGTYFNFIKTRLHHCRRCREIFCGSCSSTKRPVKLLNLSSPVRLCVRCGNEILRENSFIDKYIDLLMEGAELILIRGLLSKRSPVILRLSSDLHFLEVIHAHRRGEEDRRRSKKELAVGRPFSASSSSSLLRISLEEIAGVTEEGALGLVIMTSGGGEHYHFETCGLSYRALWISAIREASKVMPQLLSLKTRVESERHQRILQERMVEEKKIETEALLARKKAKVAERNAIAAKYGLKPR